MKYLRVSLLTLLTFLTSLALAADPRAAASTPALPPDEAQKAFKAPEGFEVRLFAAEPDVINPVAMTWDERGRLWVLELYEYPKGAKKGEKGRDRIKILEDTDGDGRADKVSVFADGFSLATGLLLGNGGVFVGQAPDFLFLEDTDGDDVADKRTVLKTGFGLQDTHELLNGFAWGPDGWLYMTHGVFTYSTVKDPNDPNDDGVKMNAAVARYHPRTKKFEIFAEGTSNPWGIDFDRYGNAFVTACVIDHLFHIVQGGSYQRQAGTPSNPYTYELLPSIVKHKHQRAAYSGICVYQGDNFPAEYRGNVFMGNIHGNCVNRDQLFPNGSSWRAEPLPDFLTTTDGWFRPVSEQVGPDGALWVMDWYDKYPCYQNAQADPAGVDRAHGRIWRIVYVGNEAGKKIAPRPDTKMDLKKLSTAELVKLLEHPNVWQRRVAQRVLSERRDEKAAPLLKKLLADGETLEARLAALWTLQALEQLDFQTFSSLHADKEITLRAWQARLFGEIGTQPSNETNKTIMFWSPTNLMQLAKDPDPTVRLSVAQAVHQLAAISNGKRAPTPVIRVLLEQPETATDPLLSFMIWAAAEPIVANDPKPLLELISSYSDSLKDPACPRVLRKMTRRIADTNKPELMDDVVKFLNVLRENTSALVIAAMDGLLDGKRKSLAKPTVPTTALLQKLIASANPEISDRAKRLAALWGDTAAAEVLLTHINDPKASDAQRLEGIAIARQLKNDKAREALLTALASDKQRIEVIQALGEVGGDAVAAEVLNRWKDFSPEARRVAIDVLASRAAWSKVLLQSLSSSSSSSSSKISVAEFHPATIRTLAAHDDADLRALLAKTVGRYRETPQEKSQLIAQKRAVVLSGAVDFKAGHEMAKKTCLNCHTLHGEGATVGPDLTGSGRASLDALLSNVIDPNQIIGKGYEQVTVTTKDEQVLSGRVIEDTPNLVKLLSAGPKEDVIARTDIASMKTSELSVMPEGLEAIPDADFRNLLWYVLAPNPTKEGKTTAEVLSKQHAQLLESSSSSSSKLTIFPTAKPIAGAKESWSRGGNLNASIVDGDPQTHRVTHDNQHAAEDWYAIEFSSARFIGRIVFAHGHNFHDGGWFDTSAGKPKIQIQKEKGSNWETVATLDAYPATNTKDLPALADGTAFEVRFAAPLRAVAIRILSKPSSGDNPAQSFSSCGELAAFGD